MDGCSLLTKNLCPYYDSGPYLPAASGIARLETGEALPKQMTAADWAEAQMQDQHLGQVIHLYKARQLIWLSYVILNLERLKLSSATDLKL